LWVGVSFVFIALNNFIVFIDLVILSDYDLLPFRRLASLAAVAVLVLGLVWESN
jgi:hypothetical protein